MINAEKYRDKLLKFIEKRDAGSFTFSSGIIYVYKSKPKKEADSWGSLSLNNELGLFNNLFQFVKWEDSTPTSIQEVLDNCEVINDDL